MSWLMSNLGNSDKQILDILNNFSGILEYQNVFDLMWNSLVWGIIKILYGINSALEKTIYKTFDLSDLFTNVKMDTLYANVITIVVVALMTLTILYLSLKFAISKRPPKAKNIFINLLMAGLLIFGAFGLTNSVTKDEEGSTGLVDNMITAEDGVKGSGILATLWSDGSAGDSSFELIKTNTYDISKVLGDSSVSNTSDVNELRDNDLNSLTEDSFKKTYINDVLTPKDAEELSELYTSGQDGDKKGKEAIEKNKELANRFNALQYRIEVGADGKDRPKDITENLIGKQFYESGYRRYYANTGIIVVSELSLTVAYLFIAITLVSSIIELGFKKFYLVLAASTDLETGQRMKTALEDIVQLLLLIAFTRLELAIYVNMMSELKNFKDTPLLYVLGIFCLTVALIKGSKSVTKIFGVDTNLKNNSSMVGALATASLLKRGADGAGKSIKQSVGNDKSALSALNTYRGGTKNTASENGRSEFSQGNNRNYTGSPSHIPNAGDKKVSDLVNKNGSSGNERANTSENVTDLSKTGIQKGKDKGTNKQSEINKIDKETIEDTNLSEGTEMQDNSEYEEVVSSVGSTGTQTPRTVPAGNKDVDTVKTPLRSTTRQTIAVPSHSTMSEDKDIEVVTPLGSDTGQSVDTQDNHMVASEGNDIEVVTPLGSNARKAPVVRGNKSVTSDKNGVEVINPLESTAEQIQDTATQSTMDVETPLGNNTERLPKESVSSSVNQLSGVQTELMSSPDNEKTSITKNQSTRYNHDSQNIDIDGGVEQENRVNITEEKVEALQTTNIHKKPLMDNSHISSDSWNTDLSTKTSLSDQLTSGIDEERLRELTKD